MENTTVNTSTLPKTPDDFPNKDLVDKFVNKILNYSQEDTEKISAAAVYAAKKHGDQKRKSGEPYLIHPIAVAEILMSYNMDADTVCAGLLHDTIEDTDTTEEDIANKEKRLAQLQMDTSGGNQLEILQLQKEIDEAREGYQDSLID